MGTKRVEVRDLQEGNYVMIDEVPCEITSYSTSKPGKHGSAKARVDAKGVFDEKKRTFTQPVDAKVRQPLIERKDGQIVSNDGSEAVIMDLESYDTFRIRTDETDIDMPVDEEIEFIEYKSDDTTERKIIG